MIEMKKIFFISFLKNKDGVIIDIGANIGIMSYHLAKAFQIRSFMQSSPYHATSKY